MLQPDEVSRLINTQNPGLFAELYAANSCDDVPTALRVSELLSSGEKIAAERDGALVFAGTVRDRPLGFLAPEVTLLRAKGSEHETARICLPLHYFLEGGTNGGTQHILGGHGQRRWVTLGEIVFKPEGICDDDLRRTNLLVGPAAIEKNLSAFNELAVRGVLEQLVVMPDDHNTATGRVHVDIR